MCLAQGYWWVIKALQMLTSQAVEAHKQKAGCQKSVCFMQGHRYVWYSQVYNILTFQSPHGKVMIITVIMEVTHAISRAFCMW